MQILLMFKKKQNKNKKWQDDLPPLPQKCINVSPCKSFNEFATNLLNNRNGITK